jgi:hypothetical protein
LASRAASAVNQRTASNFQVEIRHGFNRPSRQ